MPSPPVIDFERLLAPIPGDNPAGENLTSAGVVSDIKEMRRADEVRSDDWQYKEVKTAEWVKAIRLASDTLATRSKDLQVAAYLVECLTKTQGLAGLRDGLKLVRMLHEQYWDNLYPEIEEGDVEFRGGALTIVDSIVPMRIREQRATKAMSGAAYTVLEWEESKRVDELQRADTEASRQAYEVAIADGKITGELFRKAVGTTPKSFYETFISDLDECLEELKSTNRMIEEKYSAAEDLPVLSKVKAALETTRSLSFEIEKLVGPIRPKELGEEGGADQGAAAEVQERSTAVAYSGPGVPLDPVDREDALRRLNSVANYFRKHEPHSPVAYLVDRAVSWGQMPLERWLEEVVKDTNTLGAIRELLGIKAPADGY